MYNYTDPQQAFETALSCGALKREESSPLYVGAFMCFRRLSGADMPVTIHGDKVKGEYWGAFQADGRRFCADARSIRIIDAPSAVDMARGHGGVS